VPVEKLRTLDGDAIAAANGRPTLGMQRRPGPDHPQWKIARSQWPALLHRVSQGETYRQIARDYGVSYEAVRRVVKAARRENR
jgi:DNA invertase Pin-like site-specific DNA recombinase